MAREEIVSIYARQSLDKKDSVSIETQIDTCIKICEINGWKYFIYKDKGFSGKNLDRPDFKRMMSELKQNGTTMIMSYRLDRISRSIADFLSLLNNLKKQDVEFYSATENIDTNSPMGRAMINIIMTFAQLERETTSQRISDNVKFRALDGQFIGGKITLGFDKSSYIENGKKKSTLLENKEESKIVKDIFNWYLEKDGSIRKIALKLNTLGIKTKAGSTWDSSKVSALLRNPLYCKNHVSVYNYFLGTGIQMNNNIEDFDNENGIFIYNRMQSKITKPIEEQILIVSNHKGFLDADIWIKTQLKLEDRKSLAPRYGQSQTTVLSGLVRCGVCGHVMLATNNKKRIDNRYFNCPNKQLGICDSKLLRITPIENAVEKAILDFCNGNNDLTRLFVTSENNNTEFSKEKESLTTEINTIDDKISKLVYCLLDSDVSADYIKQEIEKLHFKKKEIEKQLLIINNKIFNTNQDINNIELIKKYIDNFNILYENATFEEKKEMLQFLVKNIIATENELKINFFMVAPNDRKRKASLTSFGADCINGQHQTTSLDISYNKPEDIFDFTKIGDVIKHARIQHGLTRYQLCDIIHCHYHALERWENNYKYPKERFIPRLEKTLNIKISPPDNYSEIIANARINKGLTKTDLSRMLKCDFRSVNDWENGRKFPRDYYKKDLEKILNIDLSVKIIPYRS